MASANGKLHYLYLRQKLNESREYAQYYRSPKEKDVTGAPEWLSIPLKKPFKLNMEENLEVGFKIQTSSPHDVYIDTNSKDKYLEVDGGLISVFVSGTFQAAPNFTDQGYMAIELVVSDNPTLSGDTIRETLTRGSLPVPFPEVKGYAIYRNDEKVGETDPSILSYQDNEGKEGDNYRIVVLYDAPKQLSIDQSMTEGKKPYLYPSVISDMATLSEADEALSLQLYDLSGRCLLTLQGDALRSSIDLRDLPEGSYIALIRTTQETFTQRVMIKRNQL